MTIRQEKEKRNRFTSFTLRVWILLTVFSLAGFSSLEAAQTIVVDTLADSADPPFNEDSICGVGTMGDLPGADGHVSLREAVIAANNTPGPQKITFAPNLSGGTIQVLFDDPDADISPDLLPFFCGGDTTLDGDLNGDQLPDITLDGSAITTPFGHGLIVVSSRNTIRSMTVENFTNGVGILVYHDTFFPGSGISNNTVAYNTVRKTIVGIVVEAGFLDTTHPGSVRNTTVTRNTVEEASLYGVEVLTGNAPGSIVHGTRLSHNMIRNNDESGLLVFTNVSAEGSHTRVSDTTITHNEGTGNGEGGILVYPFQGRNNVITGVTIARNTLVENKNAPAIEILGGLEGAHDNKVESVIRENNVTHNHFPGSTAGIVALGGFESSNNQLSAVIRNNAVTDNEGAAITVVSGEDGSSGNRTIAEIHGNAVERNQISGIGAIGGIGAFINAAGESSNNILDVKIAQNTVREIAGIGVSVNAGIGSLDGRADAIANSNQLRAVVADNTIEQSAGSGVLFAAGSIGFASSNTLEVEVRRNTICNPPAGDILGFGGFPGLLGLPPNQGVGNVATGRIKNNTATTIVVIDGVAGNTADVQQQGNTPCP